MQPLQIRRTIILTFAIFAMQPVALGAWFASIPEVKATLGLNKAELAIALLGMPLALIPTLQIASRVIARFGPRRVYAATLPIHAFAVTIPFFADGQVTLFLGLAVFGAVGAFMQVCLNVYAGRLEKQLDQMVMSRCHGFWALGLAGGSAFVGLIDLGRPVITVCVIAIVSTVPGVIAALALPRLADAQDGLKVASPKRRLSEIPKVLYAISAFAFAVAMTEGAMTDWAAIYLAERLPPAATFAGIAVTLYSVSLAAGRFVGDALKHRLGAVGLARLTIGLALTGVLLLVLPLSLQLAYVGFVLIGLGASVGFPLGVSAVAALDDQFEAQNIALMSMLSIVGFLVGAPLIGFLAELFTIKIGLMALIPGLVMSFGLAKNLRPR